MPLEPASEVKLQQGHLHPARRNAGQADDLVNWDRRGSEELLDDAKRVVTTVELSRLGMLVRRGRGADARLDRAERFRHVRRILDQRRAVADELVAALGALVERRAGHGHHFSSGLGREARRDQRT
jgi:hypothetical protein